MEREIGGNFCEEILKCDKKLEDNERIIWFDTGRSAIRFLLDRLGNKIKRVLLPQYACESVLKLFMERGYKIIYYPVDRKFQLLEQNFEQLIEIEKPQVVLVQSYFGFDTLYKDRPFLKQLRRKGIIIIEDITHSLFSKCLQSCSDYMVGSLRKWCSIPDGGFLIRSSDIHEKKEFIFLHKKENCDFLDLRLAAQMEKRKYFLRKENCSTDKNIFIFFYEKSENFLDKQNEYYTMSEYTRERFASIDWQEIANQRKSNYCTLKDCLGNIDEIKIIFSNIPYNVVPLYFPVFVDRNMRDSLRHSMREMNILLPVIWPRPSALNDSLTIEVEMIYDEILAIPCDQRYTEQTMSFIADEIKKQINRGKMHTMKSFDETWEEIHKNQEWGKYPSESVIRFVARNYYNKNRKSIKILDFCCGGGSHTWYLAREGFDVYAFDGSKSAVRKVKDRLENEGLKADIRVRDALELDYQDNFFDCVIDNVSIYANKFENITKMYEKIYSMLKPGGQMFTSIFSKQTTGYGTGEQIEKDTFINISCGVLKERGIAHFYDEKEITVLLNMIGFCGIKTDCIRYTDGGNIIEQILVMAKTENKI